MATVKAKVDCFIDNGYRNAGTTFQYDGPRLDELLEYADEPRTKLRLAEVDSDSVEADVAPRRRPGRPRKEASNSGDE